MKSYLIRVNTIDNLYADYIVEARNLLIAKLKVRRAFFKNYPGANRKIKLVNCANNTNINKAKKLIKEVG